MSENCSDVEVKSQSASGPPPIALGINIEKPKFLQYAVYQKRIASFETWPDYLPVDKDDLAEAGLVYTGVGDSVRCYFCGGGLRNWERGDVPMQEHAKWYPKCPHVLLVKGQAYIDAVARGEKPDVDGSASETKSVQEKPDNYIDSIAAESCIEMGYARQMVQQAINIFINKNGHSDFKGKDLCKILFDLEENSENVNDETFEVSTTEVDSGLTEEELEPLESLIEENQRLKENQTCKICLDSRADVIFLPCGHMVSCPQCAPALTKCPLCRKVVNGHLKAFFATTKH